MRIAIASDHNGVLLKTRLSAWLSAQGHEVDDRGTDAAAEVVDYPPLCADIGRQVVDGVAERGIMLGGSGQGEHIACNKIRGVRAGLGYDLEVTAISRGNNDSNVLVLPAKMISSELAQRIVETWLATPFKGGLHQRRLDQIAALERGETLG